MTHEIVKQIKQGLFAYRNGMLADALRNSGTPHSMILGLLLPQIALVASEHDKNKEVAEELWSCRTHRECRLAAPMLYPVEELSLETAKTWCNDILTEEEADVLCHRLLRNADFANDLMLELIDSSDAMKRYVGFRLALNLQVIGKLSNEADVLAMAQKEDATASPQLHQVISSLMEE